jgi:CRP-like cAMP-binding protein
VTALRDVLTLVLGGRVFRDVLHDRPAVAEGVLKVLTQRLRSMIRETQAP